VRERIITVAVAAAVIVAVAGPASAAKGGGRGKPGGSQATTTTAPKSTTTTVASTTTTTTVASTTTTVASTTTTTTPPAGSNTSTSAYAGRVGLSSHLFWMSETDAETQLKQMAAGGVHAVREDFLWSTIQPTSATSWNWTNSDNLMTAASRAGVGVLAILDYSAPWASSGSDAYYPPRNNADYANYAVAVVNRYGPNGSFWTSHTSLTPMPLDGVEIWNEPWGYWFWKSNPNPAAYAAMAHAAAVAIRQANPGVKILIAGDVLQVRTDGSIVNWLDNVLKADTALGSLIDGYSVHPYPSPRQKSPDDDSGDMRWNFSRIILSHNTAVNDNADHPIWITEVGWTTATGVSDGVSESTQASYLHDAITRSIDQWGSYVARVYLYSWGVSNGNMTDIEGNYFLQRSDGSFKPAWATIQSLVK